MQQENVFLKNKQDYSFKMCSILEKKGGNAGHWLSVICIGLPQLKGCNIDRHEASYIAAQSHKKAGNLPPEALASRN